MVTKMERVSRHENNDSAKGKTLDALESELKAFTATTTEKVAKAILSRNESAKDLYSAAAYAMFLGIAHGRWSQFNRLFKELPPIDSDALRQKFALRVNDKYAADGIRAKNADGEEIDSWIQRPTTMISYVAQPADKISHFSMVKAKEGEAGEAKAKLIKAFRDNVIKAGVEDLESIVWDSRDKVEKRESIYDDDSLAKDIYKVVKRAAQALGDGNSGISRAVLEMLMRDAGIARKQQIELRAVMDKYESAKSNDNAGENENGAADAAKQVAA